MSLDFFPCKIPIPYDVSYVYDVCNVLVKSYSKSIVATTHGIVLVKSSPVPTSWKMSRKTLLSSYDQIHIVQTVSFKIIYYMLCLLPYLRSLITHFLGKFPCFHLIFDIFNGPYRLYTYHAYECRHLSFSSVTYRLFCENRARQVSYQISLEKR